MQFITSFNIVMTDRDYKEDSPVPFEDGSNNGNQPAAAVVTQEQGAGLKLCFLPLVAVVVGVGAIEGHVVDACYFKLYTVQ